MFPFPSINQNIPDLLRRLRVQRLLLLAKDMNGVEEDVSIQIESIEEQIRQIEERARLFEKLWKIECEEAEDLDGGSDDISGDVAKTNHIERFTSDQTAQGVIHDKENNKIKQEQDIPTGSAIPSRIPALSRINSDSLAAMPTRSATPSSLETCKASKIPTLSTTRTAAGSSQESNTVPPSRLPESMLLTVAYNAGSKIARAKRF